MDRIADLEHRLSFAGLDGTAAIQMYDEIKRRRAEAELAERKLAVAVEALQTIKDISGTSDSAFVELVYRQIANDTLAKIEATK
jgi:hypothetical protein